MTRPTPRTGNPVKGIGPIAYILASLEGGPYYTRSEASEITGIPKNTLRYWQKHNISKAPSLEHKQGGMTIHLYTPEDLKELTRLRPPGQTRIRKRNPQ